MHPSDCPNVEETRNPMQTFSRKKCSHFSPTNIPSAFSSEIPKCVSYNITYYSKEIYAYCDNSLFFAHRCAKRCTKILKLSFAVRTLPIACSKLGKTRTIADVRTAWLETAGFAIESRLPAAGRSLRISSGRQHELPNRPGFMPCRAPAGRLPSRRRCPRRAGGGTLR